MGTDEDFAEFVGARWGSLYRLAYLLAASPTGAEALLRTTLEKAYINWGRISRMEYAEEHVRRMLAHTSVSSRGQSRNRQQPWDELPLAARDLNELVIADRDLLWPLVCALPAPQRAVIVLCYYEHLSEAQIAEVLGYAQGTVTAQSWAAIGALRRALAAAGIGDGVRES